MKIQLKNDERVIFVGPTGSGKTVLAKHFLPRLNRVVVIDPKHTFNLEGFKKRRSIPLMGKQWRVIFRPGRDDDNKLADMFDDLFGQKNVTIYIDELQTLVQRFPNASDVLADIARTGRERRVSVWMALQRPRFIPREFITEAESIFTFGLRSQEDRDYMAGYTDPIIKDPIERFTFWYTHVTEEGSRLMKFDIQKRFIRFIG